MRALPVIGSPCESLGSFRRCRVSIHSRRAVAALVKAGAERQGSGGNRDPAGYPRCWRRSPRMCGENLAGQANLLVRGDVILLGHRLSTEAATADVESLRVWSGRTTGTAGMSAERRGCLNRTQPNCVSDWGRVSLGPGRTPRRAPACLALPWPWALNQLVSYT